MYEEVISTSTPFHTIYMIFDHRHSYKHLNLHAQHLDLPHLHFYISSQSWYAPHNTQQNTLIRWRNINLHPLHLYSYKHLHLISSNIPRISHSSNIPELPRPRLKSDWPPRFASRVICEHLLIRSSSVSPSFGTRVSSLSSPCVLWFKGVFTKNTLYIFGSK